VDLHALPGGQSSDWHCDNPTDKALFWVHKDFQDRAVFIWEHLADHYKNKPWVAGYNVLNEPLEETGVILNAVMARLEKAIRAIDPYHILFWDGKCVMIMDASCAEQTSGFGSDFRDFKAPLPNSVYACHDYST
jgi:endoglucanase